MSLITTYGVNAKASKDGRVEYSCSVCCINVWRAIRVSHLEVAWTLPTGVSGNLGLYLKELLQLGSCSQMAVLG